MHSVHKMHTAHRADFDITHDPIIAFVQYSWFRKSCRILHKPSPLAYAVAQPIRQCTAHHHFPSDHSLPIWGLLTLRPALC